MNRRTFLVGLGAMACSAPPTPRPVHTRKPKPIPATNDGVRDTLLLQSQVHANRLACHGGMLVQSAGDELRAWDTKTMQRTATWALSHRHFCFVEDGTLVAFDLPRHATSSAIHRIANGKITTLQGPILPARGTNVVLPAGRSEQIYVAALEKIYLLDGGEVAHVLDHPSPNAANRDQLISHAGGVIARDHGYGLREVAPGKSSAYPTPDRLVMHLAAASRDRIWYSYATLPEDWNAHTVVLARPTTPFADKRTIGLAPARVVHLASHGDTVAVLLFSVRGSDAVAWSVALFDESGREHWRADVPEDLAPRGALNNGYIAVGEHVVVVEALGALRAWDVATGKPVG